MVPVLFQWVFHCKHACPEGSGHLRQTVPRVNSCNVCQALQSPMTPALDYAGLCNNLCHPTTCLNEWHQPDAMFITPGVGCH